MPNKYVDFVSNEDFEDCVKWVVAGYQGNGNLEKNGIDPFKTVFDMYNNNLSFESWKNAEAIRQVDKTVNNKIGEFHQKLLGCVAGWEDLQTGDVADISNDSKTIFIELKNRWNTVKGSDMIHLWKKLLKIITTDYPGSTAYWGFINEKNGTSGEDIWTHQGNSNPNVRKIWGKNIYKLVTGKEDSLEKVWAALPHVLDSVLEKNTSLEDHEKTDLTAWFQKGYAN
ncbi:MAG: Eco47II family restriction endonuclease [Thaumarchaeota archaeon]|nr:Eco47II family restriction endonuclease [Nitrososphaerota archaeon]